MFWDQVLKFQDDIGYLVQEYLGIDLQISIIILKKDSCNSHSL